MNTLKGSPSETKRNRAARVRRAMAAMYFSVSENLKHTLLIHTKNFRGFWLFRNDWTIKREKIKILINTLKESPRERKKYSSNRRKSSVGGQTPRRRKDTTPAETVTTMEASVCGARSLSESERIERGNWMREENFLRVCVAPFQFFNIFSFIFLF